MIRKPAASRKKPATADDKNMKNAIKLTVIVAALLATVIAMAQPGGGGQGQRQGGQGGGQRGQRGMMGMMGGPGGQSNSLMLLMREDVKDDIGINSEQNSQLRGLQDGMRDRMMSAFQSAGVTFGGGNRPDPAAMQKVTEEVMKGINADMAKILKPEQVKRLDEIDLQLAGNRAILREKVQKELGLSADQVSKAKALNEKAQEANRSVMEKARNREIEFTQVREINEKNNKALDDELGKLLTDANKAKLKEMGGKPFVAKDNN
jgi:hypothetical protein